MRHVTDSEGQKVTHEYRGMEGRADIIGILGTFRLGVVGRLVMIDPSMLTQDDKSACSAAVASSFVIFRRAAVKPHIS